MTTPRLTRAQRRARNTAYARAARFKKWARRAQYLTQCPARLSRSERCAFALSNRVVQGRTIPWCHRCDCKRRGICVDCRRRPVVGTVGRALRCEICAIAESRNAQRRHRQRHPHVVRQQYRRRVARIAADPALRALELAKKRAWRLLNPASAKRNRQRWAHSANGRAYQQRYRAARAEEKRAQARAYYHGRQHATPATHACSGRCGARLVGRRKKCEACHTRDQAAARALVLVA
jgi:hypothetical protein